MGILQIVLIVATLLCSLVAGLVFTFAVVVMPGIGKLEDREFLHAFQVMDRVIQDRQPWFMLVWVGSIFAVIATAALGITQCEGTSRILVILAAVIYMLGVQLPTMTINIPLNNELQKMDLDSVEESVVREFRQKFESRWNRWNTIRTVLAVTASVLLMVVMVKL